MRSCIVGLRLAERLDLEESERRSSYYVALLAWVGLPRGLARAGAWFGDDIKLRGGCTRLTLSGCPRRSS